MVASFKASAGEFTFDQMTFSNSWEQKDPQYRGHMTMILWIFWY
ncbi:hypothetical protein ACUKBL_12685 [Furfurilactobacillus rossiae]|nr:hypothetical protein [Furfurilactobacillus rossiae]